MRRMVEGGPWAWCCLAWASIPAFGGDPHPICDGEGWNAISWRGPEPSSGTIQRTWHALCNVCFMTDAPLARLLLFALLLTAAIALVRVPRAETRTFAVSLHTPHLSISVSL